MSGYASVPVKIMNTYDLFVEFWHQNAHDFVPNINNTKQHNACQAHYAAGGAEKNIYS